MTNVKVISIGDKFGGWTVIKGPFPQGKGKHHMFLCRCGCGIEFLKASSDLRTGRSVRCERCCRATQILPRMFSSVKILLSIYKRNAEARGHVFGLDLMQFVQLIEAKCHYCGAVPSTILGGHYKANGLITYNGIDRVDNTQGYVVGNLVTCCSMCNRMKTSHTVDEWFAHMKQILTHSGGV